MEGGRERGTVGGRDGGREEGREGGRERWREEGRVGGRREEGRGENTLLHVCIVYIQITCI